jgi:hypothetical protein
MRLFGRRGKASDLLDATLLVATADHGFEPGARVLDEDLAVGVRSLRDESGRQALPLFTDEQALLEWRPEGSAWIGLGGADALRLFLSGEWEVAVVDPMRRSSLEISRRDAEHALGIDPA